MTILLLTLRFLFSKMLHEASGHSYQSVHVSLWTCYQSAACEPLDIATSQSGPSTDKAREPQKYIADKQPWQELYKMLQSP